MGKTTELLRKFSNISIPIRSIKNLKSPSPKEIEIRRRNQVYIHLALLLSQISFFDFFTKESLQILVIAKKIAKYFKEKKIDEDLFLLAFFVHDSKILNFLKEKGITKKMVLSYYLEKKNRQGLSRATVILKKIDFLLQDIASPVTRYIGPILFPPKKKKVRMRASYSLLKFFEEVAELALERYKTPAISEKIFLLALLEGKSGKFIYEQLKSESPETWLILRYKILQSIYHDEFPIKNVLKTHQYQYGYLMRMNLSRHYFDNVIDLKAIEACTEVFRTKLLQEVLSLDLFDIIEKDTIISMSLRKNRKYSSLEE